MAVRRVFCFGASRTPLTFTALIASLVVAASSGLAQSSRPGAPSPVRKEIHARIELAEASGEILVGEEMVMAQPELSEFYTTRDFRPAWSNTDGPLIQAHRLVNSIHAASQHGLEPEDYHLLSIEGLLQEAEGSRQAGSPPAPAVLADLDLLSTDAFLVLGSHLLVGRVDPATIDAEWFVDERRSADLLGLLSKALASNRVGEALSSLPPEQPDYARLKDALRRYRAIAASGGWRGVPEGAKLEQGMQDPTVVALRERLMATGDLAPSQAPTEEFDEALADAVRSFQTRHGLDTDGVVGQATLEAMNVSIDLRIHQIELNLERWRWLPDRLGGRYLLVNIPAFELDVYQGHRSVLHMKAIVGMVSRPTPVFRATMTHLVLNPSWDVPYNIAVADIIPAVQKDPDYLTERNIKVFEGRGAEALEVDPSTLDWPALGKDNFPYRLRQEPGPRNALGTVKFMFPNPYNVYLHDTPSRQLFDRPDRACSSGCIRIERPIELAEYLLRDEPGWNRQKIVSALEKRVEQTVRLPRVLPVHVEYWTTFIDATGAVNFRKDVYGRDRLLDAALHENPPRGNASGTDAP